MANKKPECESEMWSPMTDVITEYELLMDKIASEIGLAYADRKDYSLYYMCEACYHLSTALRYNRIDLTEAEIKDMKDTASLIDSKKVEGITLPIASTYYVGILHVVRSELRMAVRLVKKQAFTKLSTEVSLQLVEILDLMSIMAYKLAIKYTDSWDIHPFVSRTYTDRMSK